MYFEALASGGDDWYNVVLITAPEGASITFDDGDEEVIVTGTGMQYPVPLHNDSSTYSITVNANGFVKTDSVTTSAVSGQVFTKIIKYAKITLTYDDAFRGQNFNITDGSISPSTQQVFPSTGNTIDLYVPNTGTWKTSSSAAGESYESKGVTVVDLDSSYVDELHTRPDGKTVTPTDDIQTWLECAGIRNKSYTTLAEVLADKETLQTLISDENAVDYMVRSKSWIMGNLVPTMTSNTLPEGIAFSRSESTGNEAFRAFDRDSTTSAKSSSLESTAGWYLGYIFDTPQKIYSLVCRGETGYQITWKVQVSSDTTNGTDGTWYDRPVTFNTSTAIGQVKVILDIPNAVKAIRIVSTAVGGATYFNISKLEFNDEVSLTNDSTAMHYIGLRNYASDTLLDNADWREAICDSEYWESVLNGKIPSMTTNTEPTGYGVAYGYGAFTADQYWSAFNPTSIWAGQQNQTNVWVGFNFDVPRRIYYVRCTSWTSRFPFTFKYQASDDQNFSTIGYETDSITISTASTTRFIKVDTLRAYKYHRILVTAISGGYATLGNVNFYSREDVDESVIHIYSAASDNDIHYLNGSTPVTVASTDTDGHGTIARTLLPAGTYDLYSSVAMDPDGDLSTEYFHKEVIVKADTIEIILTPDNVLYWYGYKDPVYFKNVLRERGIVYDTNNIYQSGQTRPQCGFMTDYPILPNTYRTLKTIRAGYNFSSYASCIQLFSGLATSASDDLHSPDRRISSKMLWNADANATLRSMDLSDVSITSYIGLETDYSTGWQRIWALWLET